MIEHPIRADKANFKAGLLLIQFAIATALFLAAIVVYKQLRSIQQAEKGAEPRSVLVISAPDSQEINFSNI